MSRKSNAIFKFVPKDYELYLWFTFISYCEFDADIAF